MPDEDRIYWCYICRRAGKIGDEGRWVKYTETEAESLIRRWVSVKQSVIFGACPDHA